MRKVACVVAILFMLAGCAGFGQWTPESKTKLDTFGAWADQWVGGALKHAPLIIAAVSMHTGQTTEIQAAQAAVQAAQSVLGSYHAIVATGAGDPADAQAKLVAALAAINDAISKVKTTAAILNVPIPAPAQ